MMILNGKYRVVLFVLLCAFALPATTQAQSPTQSMRPAPEDANLEIQLYLILASNKETQEGRLPPSLAPVVKQLREALTFKHFKLAATFLNRVKNNGRLEAKWFSGPLAVQESFATSSPTFSELITGVKLFTDETGRELLRLNEFRFSMSVPRGPNDNSYQSIVLRTDLSMREGSTVIAGTLNVGPTGDALIVAVSARRAN